MKKLIFCLITVVMLVMVMLPTISPSPVVGDRPIPWPTISEWEELATDDDENCNSFRDVVALYYAVDSDYIYLRMETDTEPGWPSTGSQGVARYKWWFDINGTEAYVHGTSVENAEFLLILEDRTDKSNDDGSRDKWGEITLMDDLANIGFAKRWNKGGSGGYITNTTDSGGPSSYWVRELGYGMPVVGGPQGVNGTDIGYRISGNFVDMYVSRMRLGDPTSVCLIWATDNQNPNLDQAPDCDRPEQPNCIMLGKDYGDAPDPKYPTRLASDGARHTASNITLGALIDVELDGIQSPDATGDDHSNDDDEDGVVLPPALVQGQLAKVTVNVSADGYLDAWVDFNDNGNWSDSDEQIFDMRLLSAGANNLNFTVPFSATVTNQTFARFRFSSAGNLSYVGLADDGEVEDYQVAINEALNLTCDVSPNPTKLDHATNFTAEATGGVPPYEWVWTVDGEEVAWVQNTIFTFDAGNYTAGNYTVCVNVTDSLDNKDQCCHEVTVYRAGINVDKTASPTSGVVSTDVTFTIIITNTNGCILNPVIVVDTLPNGMSYVSDNSSGVQSPTGTITWNLSSMASGESVIIELVARIDSGASGTLTNVVNATGTPPEGEDVIDSDSANVVVRVPPPPPPVSRSCPDTKYLTVDWEGNNTTEPLYSNDKLAVDLLGPSPDSSDSLLLERGTNAPVVGEKTYYLIIVRELEDIPPVPENYQAIVVINVTPADAEFNKDIFLTLGLNQTQLSANILNLTMVYYDDVNEVWVPLEFEAGGPSGVAELTLSAPINHFSIYAVLAEVAPTPPPAHFVPNGLSIVPSVEKTIFVTKTGETVTITANVANDGGQSGTYTAVLKLNGETVDTKTVTLGAGQSQPVTFTQSGLDYGQHEVEVAGLTDTFTVSRTITWWLIILIIAAIGLIIWGVVWGRRRRKAQQEAE